MYNAEAIPDVPSGEIPDFFVQHVAYPEIDGSHIPQTDAWNKQNMKALSKNDICDGRPGDDDMDFEIGYANQHVISMRWSNSYYCHGAAHGFGSNETQNIVLGLPLRPLTETDVFGSGNKWQNKLQGLFWNALGKAGWKPSGLQPDGVELQIKQAVIQMDHWTFTPEGLKASFNAYEGGCYVCTPPPVTLPWAKLKQLFSRGALLP